MVLTCNKGPTPMINFTGNHVPRPAETLRRVDAVNKVNKLGSTTPPAARTGNSYPKTVMVLGLIVLAALAVKYAPTSAADPGTCTTDYYNNALWTSCSDGSSSVCYDGGSCHYKTAADRRRGVSAWEDILRGAGFCNVVECVK